MDLARQIVEIYHGKDKAMKAEESFVNTFQKGEIPDEMTEFEITGGQETLMSISVKAKILSSKSEFRRLIKEGAITDLKSGEKIDNSSIVPQKGESFRIGKKKFIKIK